MALKTLRVVDASSTGGTVAVDVTYDDVDRRIRQAVVTVTGAEPATLTFVRPNGTEFGRAAYPPGQTTVVFPSTGAARVFMQNDEVLIRKISGFGYGLGA